jgi:hypothetical protein
MGCTPTWPRGTKATRRGKSRRVTLEPNAVCRHLVFEDLQIESWRCVVGDMAVQKPGTGIVCWESDCDGSSAKNIASGNGRTPGLNWMIGIGEVENGKIMVMEMNLGESAQLWADLIWFVLTYWIIVVGLDVEINLICYFRQAYNNSISRGKKLAHFEVKETTLLKSAEKSSGTMTDKFGQFVF